MLRVSYIEIYNESIRDLLSPEAIDLRIHEDRRVTRRSTFFLFLVVAGMILVPLC